MGYNLNQVATRVVEIYEIGVDDIYLKGKQQTRVKARRLGVSVPGVGYSVERGETIARENAYQLIE